MKGTAKLARIVPAEADDAMANLTNGTKVFVGDQELTGVTRIVLTCDINDVWRARIDCMVQPPMDLQASAVIYFPTPWQRFRRWLRLNFGPAHGFDFPG